MKKLLILLLYALFLPICGISAQNVQRTAKRISVSAPDSQLSCEITFFSPSIVRIVKYPSPMQTMPEKNSLSVIAQPENTKISYKESDSQITMTTDKINVSFDKNSGTLSFSDLKGNSLLKEGQTNFTLRESGMDKGSYIISQSFILDSDEAIYGLGQTQNGKLIQRNMTRYMMQTNLDDVVPVIHSVKGYGIFWDNYSPTTFTDTLQVTSLTSEVGDMVDYYFIYGDNADGVIAGMRTLTGQVPMLPLWTYGYWQSRERYKSSKEWLDVVNKYRTLGVPLDGIIQDWQYWDSNYLWNAMDFLNPDFKNAKQAIDELHNQNAHLIVSIWSSFGPHTLQFKELASKNMLLHFTTWPLSGLKSWPPNMDYPSGVRVYDAYNPEARDIYWKYLNKGLFSLDMDGWWMDSTEPDRNDCTDADLEDSAYLGSYRKVCNAYPLMSVGGVYSHQREVSSDKRVFILTRSAFAGQQRYGADTWTGDVVSSWETLRKQIPAGLNFSLTGIPHWNTDIGGFYANAYNNSYADGSATQNPLYQELYVRWLQFGAFCPMMRSHGTEVPREIYYYGEKGETVYDAIEKAIRLRYSLLPYIYSTSWQVSNSQYSFMRALFMDFADDKNVWNMNNEYMFGNSILVAPVVNAQYTPEIEIGLNKIEKYNKENNNAINLNVDFTETKSKELYLPEGTSWYDYWTNEKFDGGQQITRETTLDIIPLYIKAGSIIPIGPDVQYATEKPWDNLTLKVYPGSDGEFTLYEDEFDNYNYENGAYTEIPMSWNDRSQTLTIGAHKGSYNGMLATRSFNIILPDGSSKCFNYNGKKISVNF
ncbi:MAG: glycoside hydrolase family 31 protein [Prevotella sp.]|nr:glycoside hydrolase family 31 protein [Prevotella sp.]